MRPPPRAHDLRDELALDEAGGAQLGAVLLVRGRPRGRVSLRVNANVDPNPNTSPSPSPSPNSDSNPTPSHDLSVEALRLEEGEQAHGLEVRHEGGLVADGDLVSSK